MSTRETEDTGRRVLDPAEELFEGLYGGDDDAVVRALRAGVPAEASDEDGQTALYLAAAQDRPVMVRLLLAAGADPDRASGTDGAELPLCGAAVWGRTEVMRALLSAGARPDLEEAAGVRALTWACRQGRAEAVELLLAHGADPDRPGPGEEPPLVTAARRGSPSSVRALLRHGVVAREDALTEARRWLGVDVEEELRRTLTERHREEHGDDCATYAEIVSRRVEEDGGVTVVVELHHDGGGVTGAEQQTGHAAVATLLEEDLGLRTPADTLAERALRRGDPDQDDWTEAVAVLQRRGDEDTFRAAAAWCGTEDPLRQTFAADVLAGLSGDGMRARAVPLLRELSREARDPEVIRAAVAALGQQADPAGVTEILRHAGNPDPEVRFGVAVALHGLLPAGRADGVEAVVALSRDPDDGVRDWATTVLADVDEDTPAIRDALADRLDDAVPDIEAEAARGLAMRQDTRAVEALARILENADPDGYAYSTADQAVDYVADERVRRRLEATVPRSR
ncbi:ankyrin repeat domain-containing protein [Streptomyces sp. NPDC019208]|uniref:ankyrin repeat domain-containing protein n=1 Tax=unclassified Streptomyces TaxID=2593676 RepID=UPI0033C4A964